MTHAPASTMVSGPQFPVFSILIKDQNSTAESAPITIRTRKFFTNRLLSRRQFIIDVLHPCRPNVSRAELAKRLAAVYNSEPSRVVLFGFHAHFGGQCSTGFGLIYDDEASQIKFEFRNRLVKVKCYCSHQINVCLIHHCRFLVWIAASYYTAQPTISIAFQKLCEESMSGLRFIHSHITDLWYHKFRGREAAVQRAKSRKFK